MSILTANLRLGWQCRRMWIIQGLTALVCLPLVGVVLLDPQRSDERGFFAAYLVIAYFAGYLTTAVLRETYAKPFTFCLPGHRTVARRLLARTGIAVALVLGPLYLRYPDLVTERGWAMALCGAWSAAGLALILFLAAAALAWRATSGGIFWGLPLVLIWRVFAGLHRRVAEALPDLAVPVTVIAAIAFLLVWRDLQGDRQARRLSGQRYLAFHESMNRRRIERYRRAASPPRGRRTPLIGVLASLTGTGGHRSGAATGRQAVRGELFVAFGRLLSAGGGALAGQALLGLLFVAVLGYDPIGFEHEWNTATNASFLIPCIAGLAVVIPLFSPLVTTAGRRQRLAAALAVALGGAVLTTALGLLCHLASHLLASLLPVLSAGGRELAFRATDWRYAYLPATVLPLCYGCQVIFDRYASIPQTILLIILACWLLFGARGLHPAGPWGLAAALVASWGLFWLLVRHRCWHGDLVRA